MLDGVAVVVNQVDEVLALAVGDVLVPALGFEASSEPGGPAWVALSLSGARSRCCLAHWTAII